MPAKAPVKNPLWLPLVIALEINLVALYAITVLINAGEPFPLLDVNGFRTLPSWLQTTQMFLLGALPLWLAITYRQPKVPPSRNLLIVVGLFFLFASIDELFKLSVLFQQHQLSKSIYLSLAVIIPVLFHRDVAHLYRLRPKAIRLIVIGIIIFLAGGFGLELFRRHIQEPYWYQLFGRWKFHQVDAIRTAFEEFGEMLGETLILKGMITLAHWRRARTSEGESHSI